ncbi:MULTISPECIES: hypothetical protein [unclassified Leifsonia]|uniref:hypothetical protein n=1 Tax=unclassified Leifsonia TaxID=2663824 RepID=UPI0008A80195|nr:MULTISPECIES: hypothetical protein [unclassified Leifsonia]SEI02117.1 hypothetical protein SAMN04515694_11041 [Leifsonia sp. CL154]SFL70655.1 hypothetical protein SAMN04515692_11041 [Leifsonia sp. CL147]
MIETDTETDPGEEQVSIPDQLRSLLDGERGMKELAATKPVWYPALVRQLELAVGDDEIIYLGAATATSASAVTLRVGIFTASMVVAAEVVDDGSPGAHVTTRVEGRAALEWFELSGGQGDDGSDSPWPGGFRIRAYYRSGLTVTVPANVVDTEAKRVSVHGVLDGIRADLKARM